MKHQFLSRFESDNLKKTLTYLIIAVLLITASLLIGLAKKDNSFAVILLFIGCVVFFYAALHPWEKVIYYLILVGISIVLIILLFKVGVGLLVKMNLPGHGAEDIAWLIGGICVAAFIAGIIGALRFRKID